MIYRILNGETVVNTIVSNEDFVKDYCSREGCTYELVSDTIIGQNPEPPAPPTELEQLRADVDFLAAMGGVTL